MTHKATWKNLEREVAEFFGGHRTPLSGMSNVLTKSDIIHEDMFVECKYRKRFPVIEKFSEFKRTAEKAPVFSITDPRIYGENVWLFSPDDYITIIGGAKQVESDEGLLRLIILKNRLSYKSGVKAKAVLGLYKETVEKAEREGKIPFVALRMRGKQGWYLVCNPKYFTKITPKKL